MSEETFDNQSKLLDGPTVRCETYKNPHTLNVGHTCKNPK